MTKDISISTLSYLFVSFLRVALSLLVGLSWITGQGMDRVQAARPFPGPRLTAEQAIAVAVNTLQQSQAGYQLSHPDYIIDFTLQGLQVLPRYGGPTWRWELAEVTGGNGEPPAVPVIINSVRPVQAGGGSVVYERGGLVEQYLLKADHVEQQFLLSQPLLPAGVDLVIRGWVSSRGELETGVEGWLWRTAAGAVHLGQVQVFDAVGQEIGARLEVTATRTQLVVDGLDLARAVYPVTIDPEIGTNDFRLSDAGPDGTSNFQASDTAVAYNPSANEYLVVWSGEDDIPPSVDNKLEIFGQRINAATGAEVGPNDFRISEIGFQANEPAVAYNPIDKEYLVVWWGDDNTPPLVQGENEIFGQRLDAATGVEIGNDFRLSDMGPDGDDHFWAMQPAVAYNSTDNEYLVVWLGEDDISPLANDEFEVFGQRIEGATGAEVGTNDFRISHMGSDGASGFLAFHPAVAYNSMDNEYLVVWSGKDQTPPLVDDEQEIFGQRIDATNGAEVGADDFRLSDMGPDGDPSFGANDPDVAYNSTNNEYLVVWSGEDNIPPLVAGEGEIFGQRVKATTGAEVGPNDFRLSSMGPDGSPNFWAAAPAVAYNSTNNEYFVIWTGNSAAAPPTVNELEIFGQRLDGATLKEVGPDDVRLSDMGLDGNSNANAFTPALAYNSTGNEYLVIWPGDDGILPLVDEEHEIFGQRYLPDREIEVRGNNVEIVDGDNLPTLVDHTDFGPVPLAQAKTRTFTIVNRGAELLNLTGLPLVKIEGPAVAHFKLIVTPTASISGGNTTSFQVRFSSVLSGSQGVTVTIANDDSDENLYHFTLLGTGANKAPLANAGVDQTAGSDTLTRLNGSNSSDPDGHLPLSFHWNQTGGPPLILSSATISQPTFIAPKTATVLTFSLVVTDTFGLVSASDEVVITITNPPPPHRLFLPLVLKQGAK